MTLLQATITVLGAAGILAVVILCSYRVVVWARRQAKGAYIVGALLWPFMALGKVTDPDFRIVMEAQLHRKREEGEPGDPPNPNDEPDLEAESVEDAPRRPKARRRWAWWRLWRR